jgi:hypothetical protein
LHFHADLVLNIQCCADLELQPVIRKVMHFADLFCMDPAFQCRARKYRL